MAGTSCTEPLCTIIAEELQGIRIIRLTKVASVASLTLFAYDYVSTLADEFNLMWRARLGPGKVVYFALRYLTLALLIFVNFVVFSQEASSELCFWWIKVQWIFAVIVALLVKFMLWMRVYAFYSRSRPILVLLITAFTATAAAMSGLSAAITSKEKASFLVLGPGIDARMCVPGPIPPTLLKVYFAPMFADDTLLLLLVFVKAKTIMKEYKSMGLASQITTILWQDSVICFTSRVTMYLISQLIWAIGGEQYIQIPVGFIFAVASMACQRLCLSFRKGRDVQVTQAQDGQIELLRFSCTNHSGL